jgi:hypothetical protein
MLKNKNFLLVILVAVFLLVRALPAFAEYASAYGPKEKRFGAGIYLGEPTGVTLKGYLTQRLALDGVAAWSFIEDSLTLIADVTYEFFDINVNAGNTTLPFYAGAGAKMAFDGGRNDDTSFGVRVPVGIAVQWVKHPVEIFLEVAPGIELAPRNQVRPDRRHWCAVLFLTDDGQ